MTEESRLERARNAVKLLFNRTTKESQGMSRLEGRIQKHMFKKKGDLNRKTPGKDFGNRLMKGVDKKEKDKTKLFLAETAGNNFVKSFAGNRKRVR